MPREAEKAVTSFALLAAAFIGLAILVYLLRRSLPHDDFEDDVDWLSEYRR